MCRDFRPRYKKIQIGCYRMEMHSWLFLLVLQSFLTVSCQEDTILDPPIVRKTFCWNQDFRLDCSYNNIVAIHEAYFTNDQAEVELSSCPEARILPTDRQDEFCKEDIRPSLNERCSGMSHCHYNLTQDHKKRQCYCKGIMVLRYACVQERNLVKSCNMRVSGSSGYISSPGYPRFYPQSPQCNWVLEESKGQEMELSVLDMDLRPVSRRRGFMENCPDSVTVFEDFHKLRYMCGSYNNETARTVISSGKRVHLEFKSLEFMPSRGFLLFYKAHGCPTLPPPKLGYMVYRNKTTAFYMCCRDHIFNETQSNLLYLHCIDNMRWNGTVPPCIDFDEHNSTANWKDIKLDIVEVHLKRNKYVEEILIPSACVVGLVFGHVAAIIIFMKLRKHRKSGTASQHPSRPQTIAPLPPPFPPESILPPVVKSKIMDSKPQMSEVPLAPRVLITDL